MAKERERDWCSYNYNYHADYTDGKTNTEIFSKKLPADALLWSGGVY